MSQELLRARWLADAHAKAKGIMSGLDSAGYLKASGAILDRQRAELVAKTYLRAQNAAVVLEESLNALLTLAASESALFKE